MESNNLCSGNHSLSWPLHWFIDFTKIREALEKYNVTADQISAVVHDKAANTVLAGKGLLWFAAMHSSCVATLCN